MEEVIQVENERGRAMEREKEMGRREEMLRGREKMGGGRRKNEDGKQKRVRKGAGIGPKKR